MPLICMLYIMFLHIGILYLDHFITIDWIMHWDSNRNIFDPKIL